jgi:hypothetical protein
MSPFKLHLIQDNTLNNLVFLVLLTQQHDPLAHKPVALIEQVPLTCP